MNRRIRSVLCAAVLFIMGSSLARAADSDCCAPAQSMETACVTPCDCDTGPSCCATPLSLSVPNQGCGWEFTADLLYLRPGADNLGYATVTTFLPLGNPQWSVETLEPDYQPGFSIGARYAFGCSGKDLRVNWERLRTSDSASTAVSDPNTQWISPFNQTGPSTSESSNEVGVFHLKAADGQVDFDYDLINILVDQTVNVGSNTQLRLFAGVTWVQLKEQLISRFYNDPNINPVPPVVAITDPDLRYISLNNTSTYSGAGPRLGLTTTHNLCHGFTFVGELSGAILEGTMQPAQYSFAAVFDDVVNSEQIKSRSVSQVVYAADAKLGAGYSRPFDNGSTLKIESGFKAAVFVNPFSTYETSTNVLPLDIGSLSTNSMRHTPSDFTLSGFYLTCGLQW